MILVWSFSLILKKLLIALPINICLNVWNILALGTPLKVDTTSLQTYEKLRFKEWIYIRFFPVERGVRQSCPLSPYLFIISIELLPQMVSREDLKIIRLSGIEFRKSPFADDTSFISDGSVKSFKTLVRILENFSNISGLKISAKKCQVLRIGKMEKSIVIYLKNRKFHWSSTEANTLGLTFTTTTKKKKKKKKENIFHLNLKPKILDFRKCLQRWQHRKLTLMGKITVIKPLLSLSLNIHCRHYNTHRRKL